MNIEESFIKLEKYCREENYKGWDPYDGLNSKLFQNIPFLKKWDLARLVWIQGFKRSPINFRKIMLVPKEYNAMGLGLFLQGYCNLYKISKNGNDSFGSQDDLLKIIIKLSDLLLSIQTKGYSGACWGYNFDWQARRLFLFPKYTPTVVATSFCAEALFTSYNITENKIYLNTALSSAEFIMKDLNRTPHKSGFLFSYSPYNGNNTVFNASLLGAKLLATCYKYNENEAYKQAAETTIRAICESQESDGSWVYGLLPIQSWKDSFHTGFNLDAIHQYMLNTGDNEFKKYLDKGLQFYLKNFFKSDGLPKYYHNKTHPIDIHCPGQLIVTLSKLNVFKSNEELIEKVLNWTIANMQDEKGFFYYQIKKRLSSKISYMRWSNAFMFNAMSYYLLEKNIKKNEL